MIHHVSLGTNDVGRARAFYDPVLEVLGLRFLKSDEEGIHYGTGDIFFSVVRPSDGKAAVAGNGAHIAFVARNHEMVCTFHETAVQHGGRSNGAPGVRSKYGPNYFGAFVLDPDGNKIEAVSFSP